MLPTTCHRCILDVWALG